MLKANVRLKLNIRDQTRTIVVFNRAVFPVWIYWFDRPQLVCAHFKIVQLKPGTRLRTNYCRRYHLFAHNILYTLIWYSHDYILYIILLYNPHPHVYRVIDVLLNIHSETELKPNSIKMNVNNYRWKEMYMKKLINWITWNKWATTFKVNHWNKYLLKININKWPLQKKLIVHTFYT